MGRFMVTNQYMESEGFEAHPYTEGAWSKWSNDRYITIVSRDERLFMWIRNVNSREVGFGVLLLRTASYGDIRELLMILEKEM